MPEENLTTQNSLLLTPGTLWTRVKQQTEHALACGALKSIPTQTEVVEQYGINFSVRLVLNLIRKDEDKKQQEQKSRSGKYFNPFLPYDQNLFVSDISQTHLCLLNKFNVVDHHLLIVTREFEEQENWLNERDFEAMWACFAEIDGLAFYNAGEMAGASQRHKHLQLVPLPLCRDGQPVPISPAIATAQFSGEIGQIAAFPFVHAIARLEPSWTASPTEAGRKTLQIYDLLLDAVGLSKEGDRQTGAYNFLATREWMLIVPRSRPFVDTIGVNSLGFAGTFLVRTEQEMANLKADTPITILKSVAKS